jgi:hypothetical protein
MSQPQDGIVFSPSILEVSNNLGFIQEEVGVLYVLAPELCVLEILDWNSVLCVQHDT